MHNELDYHSTDEHNREFVPYMNICDNEFLFQADPDVTVLREDKMKEILDAIADENEQDTLLLFLRFVREILAKLRLKLLGAIDDDDILLQDVPSSISRGELLDRYLFDDVFFQVKKPRCSGSMPPDPVKF
jgi:hypothetical protein